MKFKKSTYVIDIEKLHPHFYDFHSSKKEMPLPLLSLNGQILPQDGFSIPTKMFPNPQTQEMIYNFNENKSSRTELSLTIVEYCTIQNKPVAYLFPNGSVSYTITRPNANIRKALNRDLTRQINIRKSLIERIK